MPSDQENLKKIFGCLGVLGGIVLLLFCVWLGLISYAMRDRTPRGPLPAASDWPEPIRRMHASLEELDLEQSKFEVYLLYGQPGSLSSTVLCRIDSSTEVMEALTERLQLKPISRDHHLTNWFGSRDQVPDDWRPSFSPATDYFADKYLLAGDEGDQYVVARDTTRKKIYVLYHFNF